MQSRLERALLATPPISWIVRQVVVFDWHDGPREGVCELEHPAGTFHFEIIAEQRSNGGFSDRLFTISELAAGTVGDIVAAFGHSAPPRTPSWAPHGTYASDEEQRRIEDAIERLLAPRMPTRMLVRTRDMVTFTELWTDSRIATS